MTVGVSSIALAPKASASSGDLTEFLELIKCLIETYFCSGPCFIANIQLFPFMICGCHESGGNDMCEAGDDHGGLCDGLLGICSKALAFFLPFCVCPKWLVGVHGLLELPSIIIPHWNGDFCILCDDILKNVFLVSPKCASFNSTR